MSNAQDSINPANKTFQLAENDQGHAGLSTTMRFSSDTHPYRANYEGPNIVYGSALMSETESKLVMLYQQLNADQNLTAGRADVKFL